MASLQLKSSAERIGQLYPILVDYHGNIIDEEHRFGVDEKWRTVRLEHIRTEKDRLVARVVSNTVRRSVPSKEKTELLKRLGEIYLNEGVKPGKIAYKIAEETGMSYRWVMKYLPDRFKDSAQSERASSAARCAAGENPKRERSFRGAEKNDAVEEAYMVYGVHDVVAKVKADTMDELKEIVTWHVRRLDKVHSTITMIVIEETK